MSIGNESDPFACKSREQWMRDAANAFIASTLPHHRYMFIRGGFVMFQNLALPLFRELAGLHFDSNEVRKIFEYICGYAYFKERRLHPAIEMSLAQVARRSWKPEDAFEQRQEFQRDLIEVDRVHRGVLERSRYTEDGKQRVA